MFFSKDLLWKKGALGNIWVAAYCFNKLKKKQLEEIDIPSSVDQIINDLQKSYRILAYLLLGIVKIFSKKVDYVDEDCKEVLKILTESFHATYWTNLQKSTKHVNKHKDVPEPSDLANQGLRSIETMRGFSIPERFELDLFDLGIDDDGDAPDTHQPRAHQDSTIDEREHDLFILQPYQRESGRFGDFDSDCFTPIQDIIPMEMIMDLNLDINELMNLNEANNSVDQGSTQSIHAEDTNLEAEETLDLEPSIIITQKDKKSSSKDKNIATSPSKDKNIATSPSKDKNIATNLTMLETEQEPFLPTEPGWASPILSVQTPAKREVKRKWKIVGTPAKNELARKLKRRKICPFDEKPILENEVMRQTTKDASDLHYKRRKVPHTNLDIWRQKRFESVENLFTDPLYPCAFSKSQAQFHSRAFKYNTPEKPKSGPHDKQAAISGSSRNEQESERDAEHDRFDDVSDSRGREPEMEHDAQKDGFSDISDSRGREPEMEHDAQNDRFADISDSRGRELEIDHDAQNDRIADISVSRGREMEIEHDAQNDRIADISESVHDRSEGTRLGFESVSGGPTQSIDRDFGSHEGDDSVEQPQQGSSNIWSARTRYVAQHLYEKFSELKKHDKESYVSLENILEGKKRKTSARFFYETLTLKVRDLIDVKQETPYGDIKIFETPLFEKQFRV